MPEALRLAADLRPTQGVLASGIAGTYLRIAGERVRGLALKYICRVTDKWISRIPADNSLESQRGQLDDHFTM